MTQVFVKKTPYHQTSFEHVVNSDPTIENEGRSRFFILSSHAAALSSCTYADQKTKTQYSLDALALRQESSEQRTQWAFALGDGLGHSDDEQENNTTAEQAAAVTRFFVEKALSMQPLDSSFIRDLQEEVDQTNLGNTEHSSLSACRIHYDSNTKKHTAELLNVGDGMVIIVGIDGTIKYQLSAKKFGSTRTNRLNPYSTKMFLQTSDKQPKDTPVLENTRMDLIPGETVILMSDGAYSAFPEINQDTIQDDSRVLTTVLAPDAFSHIFTNRASTPESLVLAFSEHIFLHSKKEKYELLALQRRLPEEITRLLIKNIGKFISDKLFFDFLKECLFSAFVVIFLFDARSYKSSLPPNETGNKDHLVYTQKSRLARLEFEKWISSNNITDTDNLIKAYFSSNIFRNSAMTKILLQAIGHRLKYNNETLSLSNIKNQDEITIHELMVFLSPANELYQLIKTHFLTLGGDKITLSEEAGLSDLIELAVDTPPHEGDDVSLIVFKVPELPSPEKSHSLSKSTPSGANGLKLSELKQMLSPDAPIPSLLQRWVASFHW